MQQTIENLTKAFIGESMARNRYTFYAKVAKKEGFEQIADIFLLTADQEREHAKWLFRLINVLKKKSETDYSEIIVEAGAPTDLGDTAANLRAAIAGETHEYTEMYPEFAEVAEREGHPDIARRLKAIAMAEEYHAERYAKLLKRVEDGTTFKRDRKIRWACRKCGHVHEGEEPPKACSACGHPRSYFEAL